MKLFLKFILYFIVVFISLNTFAVDPDFTVYSSHSWQTHSIDPSKTYIVKMRVNWSGGAGNWAGFSYDGSAMGGVWLIPELPSQVSYPYTGVSVAWCITSGCGVYYDFYSNPSLYSLIVVNGITSGSFASGSNCSISPTIPQGKVFDYWTASGCTLNSVSTSAVNSITMPSVNCSVTATFKDPPPGQFNLTVTGGTGTGYYTAGINVPISPTLPENQTFTLWTPASCSLNSASSVANNSITMPSNDCSVTASFSGSSTDTLPKHVIVDNFSELSGIVTTPIVNKLGEVGTNIVNKIGVLDTNIHASFSDLFSNLAAQHSELIETLDLNDSRMDTRFQNLNDNLVVKLTAINTDTTAIKGDTLTIKENTTLLLASFLELKQYIMNESTSTSISVPDVGAIAPVERPALPELNDNTTVSKLPDDLKPGFAGNVKDKMLELKNSNPGTANDWVLPLHTIYSGLEDITFNFSGTGAYPIFNELRLLCRGALEVILWLLGIFQWFSIMRSLFSVV